MMEKLRRTFIIAWILVSGILVLEVNVAAGCLRKPSSQDGDKDAQQDKSTTQQEAEASSDGIGHDSPELKTKFDTRLHKDVMDGVIKQTPRGHVNASDGYICPPEFFDLTPLGVNMCVFHTMMRMDWFYAQSLCQSMGADLVNPLTRHEMAALVYFMQIPPFTKDYQRREVALYWPHWLGLNNLEGKWLWYAEGKTEPVENHTTFWDLGEPSGSKVCVRFHAGRMSFEKGWRTWQVSRCDKKRPFLCSYRPHK